jgi:hypothetical protein
MGKFVEPVKLPGDYLRFLELSNGGYLGSPDGTRFYHFRFRSPLTKKLEPGMLRRLYSIGCGANAPGFYCDVEMALNNLQSGEKGYPRNLVPFADGDPSVILGMYVSGENAGGVFAFQQDSGFANGGSFVARSFDEFVSKLTMEE